jgi:serine/threonine protein kinase
MKPKEDGTTRRRPAPNATVKLTETGLIPVQPPAAVSPPALDVLAYLPPERVDGNTYDARGDIYMLGASLYLLLAGRPPFVGETVEELLLKVRSVEPAALGALRPSEAPEFTALVMTMLSKRPENRPQTAAEVCQALAPFCRPGVLPTAPQVSALPQAIPVSLVPHAVPAAPPTVVAVPVEVSGDEVTATGAQPEPDAWGVNPNAFAEAHAASAADTSQPRRRQLTDADKTKTRLWIAVGLCLHLTAVSLFVAFWLGAFDSTPTPPDSNTEPEKKKSDPAKPKQKKQKTTPERDPG